MTKKLLRIAVDASLADCPEILALADKGHTITVLRSLADYDIVFGPGCYRLYAATARMVDMAVRSVRAVKYAGKGARGGKTEKTSND